MVLTTGIVCTIIVQKQVVVALVCWCVVELHQKLQGTPDVCGQLESAHQCPLISACYFVEGVVERAVCNQKLSTKGDHPPCLNSTMKCFYSTRSLMDMLWTPFMVYWTTCLLQKIVLEWFL